MLSQRALVVAARLDEREPVVLQERVELERLEPVTSDPDGRGTSVSTCQLRRGESPSATRGGVVILTRALATLVAAGLVSLGAASSATAADRPGPPPIQAPGSTLTVEEVKAKINFRERESGFALSGNLTLRISDEDSSVVVRLPGRVTVELTRTGGIVTNPGRTLLVPDPTSPFIAEAIAAADLPELPLTIGRVVTTDTVDPVTGEFTGTEITGINGRVVDVCGLLARS